MGQAELEMMDCIEEVNDMESVQNRSLAKILGKGLYYLAVVLLAAAFVAGGIDAAKSDSLFIAFWGSILAGSLCFSAGRKAVSVQTAAQLGSISLYMTVFWLAALRESIVYQAEYHKLIAFGGSAVLIISTILWMTILFRRENHVWASIGTYIKDNAYALAVILLFFILSLECFTFLYKSDSNVYYTTLVANEGHWTFSLSDIKKFQIGYHSTYGYSIFAYLGNYLIRFRGIGIRLMNMAMIAATVLCLNDILRRNFPKKDKGFYALLLAVFAFNPLILGLIQEMCTDLAVACFLVWFVWACMRRQKAFTVLFACLACFAKENAVLFLFGYVVGIYLYRLIQNRSDFSFSLIFRALKAHEWMILIAPILLAVDMVLFNAWGGESDATSVGGMNMVNTIHVNPVYIGIRLRQMFVMNFQWIVPLLLVIGVIAVVFFRRKIRMRETKMGLLCSFICYAGFNVLYFTYPHYRYLIPSAFFFTVFIASMMKLIPWKFVRNGLLTIIAALFMVQSFVSVDPVTNRLFKTVSTGNGRIMSQVYYGGDPSVPNRLLHEDEGANLSNEVFRDYVQNNRQYTRFEQCFEKAMEQIEYSDNKAIILSPIYQDGYWGNDVWTITNMLGTLYPETLRWNAADSQLTYEASDTPIHWLDSANYAETFGQYEEVWYIELPYDTTLDLDAYRSSFEILESQVIEYGQWLINIYRVQMK